MPYHTLHPNPPLSFVPIYTAPRGLPPLSTWAPNTSSTRRPIGGFIACAATISGINTPTSFTLLINLHTPFTLLINLHTPFTHLINTPYQHPLHDQQLLQVY